MYILEFLTGFRPDQSQDDTVEFEYRLLCSGELFNARTIGFDWRKSSVARILFEQPFKLIVCSEPFNEFPQELALRFSAPMVTVEQGIATSSFYPDEEIAHDLAALLSLFCRRLITVAAKVRETRSAAGRGEPDPLNDWPVAFAKFIRYIHWTPKPVIVSYGSTGVEQVINYNPPSLGIDSSYLRNLFSAMAQAPAAKSIVSCAKLYSLALQQLENDTDIAYQLLISSVEVMANHALSDFRPPDNERIEIKRSVSELAARFGLDQQQAKQLALAATNDMSWTKLKFITFLVENATDELWEEDKRFQGTKCIHS